MSYFVGQLVGGVVAIGILSLLFRLVFRRFFVGVQLALVTVACAVAVATFGYAFGSADGGDPKFGAGFAQYGIGGVVILIVWLARMKPEDRNNG